MDKKTEPIKIAFVERVHEYADVYTYIFRPKERLEFIAGQNACILIPSINESRSLSFASPPHETDIQFSLHVGSGSLYKKALKEMKKGHELHLVKTKGKTLLPEDISIPVVLIAGGVGITPFRSIMLDAAYRKLSTKITLIHVSSEEYLYEEDLSILPFEQKRIRRGAVAEVITNMTLTLPEAMYFVVGSVSFLGVVEKILHENYIPEDMIRISRFKGYENVLD